MRLPNDSAAGRQQFERSMEERRAGATAVSMCGTDPFTALSILMQSALSTYDKNSKVLGAMDDTSRKVEDFLSNHQPDRGLELLASVKAMLARMAGKTLTRR